MKFFGDFMSVTIDLNYLIEWLWSWKTRTMYVTLRSYSPILRCLACRAVALPKWLLWYPECIGQLLYLRRKKPSPPFPVKGRSPTMGILKLGGSSGVGTKSWRHVELPGLIWGSESVKLSRTLLCSCLFPITQKRYFCLTWCSPHLSTT